MKIASHVNSTDLKSLSDKERFVSPCTMRRFLPQQNNMLQVSEEVKFISLLINWPHDIVFIFLILNEWSEKKPVVMWCSRTQSTWIDWLSCSKHASLHIKTVQTWSFWRTWYLKVHKKHCCFNRCCDYCDLNWADWTRKNSSCSDELYNYYSGTRLIVGIGLVCLDVKPKNNLLTTEVLMICRLGEWLDVLTLFIIILSSWIEEDHVQPSELCESMVSLYSGS